MEIQSAPHWGGDAERYCAELHIACDRQADAAELATLLRVLKDPETRAQLLSEAKRIDAGAPLGA